MSFEQELVALWEQRVAGQCLYRGMGKHDLTDPLDPDRDPFVGVRQKLSGLFDVLEQATTSGFGFTVHEDHSGMSFDLGQIVAWTKRDLESPGMDFTSSYADACGYAQNLRGSQLMQNVKYITDHLPGRKGDAVLGQYMAERDWDAVTELSSWISDAGGEWCPVVVCVERSAPAFCDCDRCLPLGPLTTFARNVVARVEQRQLPMTPQSAVEVLPKGDFCYRLRRKLSLDGSVRIEELERAR